MRVFVRLSLILAAVLALGPSLEAQQPVRLQSTAVQDTLSSNGDSVTLTNYNIGGFGSVKIQTLDSYSGTWEVQCSLSGTVVDTSTITGATFDTDDEVPVTLLGATSSAASVTDTVGIWTADAAGCRAIKVIATAGFAASDTVVVISATQSGGTGSGSGGSGSTFDGVLLDAAAGDAITDTVNDALKVNVVAGGGSGGTALADDADFTAGTTNFTPSGGFYQSVVTACTDGDTCAFGITAQRTLKATLFSAAGAELTPATDKAEDAASANGDTGPVTMAIRDDTLDARSGTEGDYEPLHLNANGALWIADVSTIVDDAAFTPGTSRGFPVGGQADDTSTDSVDEGDFGAFRISLDRLLYTRLADPCSGGGTKQYIPIDIVTATTTELTASLAGASTHYYICALNLVTSGANNVAIVDDNTDNCGSPTAGVFGGFGSAAEGWNFAANGGIVLGNGTGSIGRTTTANSVLCVITSAAVQLSGQIVVVAAP
jgi:hypothetical protein